MNFLRSCSWLLPTGFFLAVFTFLLTHGPTDPALAVYPLLRDWVGSDRMPKAPEVAFLCESGLLFLLPYVLLLAFVFLIAIAERAVFGKPGSRAPGPVRRSFVRVYVVFVLFSSALIGASTGVLRRKLGGNTQVGALTVAAAPFAASVLAAAPALVLAIPVAGFLRLRE